MGKSKIITYIAIAILVLIGLFWVYWMVNKGPEKAVGGVSTVTNATALSSTNDQTNQFVSILNDIDSLDLQNRLILSNKIFTSLEDFGRPVGDRAIGRSNPFSPSTGKADLETPVSETPPAPETPVNIEDLINQGGGGSVN